MSGNNVYPQYPDNQAVKDVQVYADSNILEDERHVYIGWVNSENPLVMQIAHLTGGPGNYSFITPQAKQRFQTSVDKERKWNLGNLTRAQRDELLTAAKGVKFNMKTKVNNCQVWMRYVLEALVTKGLITQAIVDKIIKEVPLMEPKPDN